jgi:hypothetical protein
MNYFYIYVEWSLSRCGEISNAAIHHMMYCSKPGSPVSPYFGNIDLLSHITLLVKVKEEKALINLYQWLNILDIWPSRKCQGFDPGYHLVFFFFFNYQHLCLQLKVRNRKRKSKTERKTEGVDRSEEELKFHFRRKKAAIQGGPAGGDTR